MQQPIPPTFTYPTQSLIPRYLPILHTATANNPHQITTQQASTHIVSLPQSPEDLPVRKMHFINELRRMGFLQARNAGMNQSENPFLFNQQQMDRMQSLLPLDRHREHLASRRLKTIQSQIEECQVRLSWF